MFDWLIDWLIDWLTDWLIDWLDNREIWSYVYDKRELFSLNMSLTVLNFFKKKKKTEKKVVSRYQDKNWFGLFLSAIFLFREILNLNVPIAFVVSMILNLSIIAA